jgi:DNA-directed RNA polymerase specialized sigma24 family protein
MSASSDAAGEGEGMDDRLGPTSPTPTKVESQPPETLPGCPPEEPVLDPESLAESAMRLQADCKLRDVLAAGAFTGPAYAVFEEELAGYGHQVMTAWLATGKIFTRCREAGLNLLSLRIPLNEREDLAQETVAEALRIFKRTGLQRGDWRPEGGASLNTYFTRALLHQFANIWRKRLRARAPFAGPSLDTLPSDTESPAPGPAEISEQRDEIRRGLAGIENDRTRAALVLAEDGYQQEEIAEILGADVTPRAVEGYLRRHRRHLAARNDEEGRPR